MLTDSLLFQYSQNEKLLATVETLHLIYLQHLLFQAAREPDIV